MAMVTIDYGPQPLAHVAVRHTCLGNVCLNNGCLGNGCLGMDMLQCSNREGGAGPATGRSRWRRVREQNFFLHHVVTQQVATIKVYFRA